MVGEEQEHTDETEGKQREGCFAMSAEHGDQGREDQQEDDGVHSCRGEVGWQRSESRLLSEIGGSNLFGQPSPAKKKQHKFHRP